MGTKTLPLKTRGERKLPLLCSNNNKRQNNNKNRNNIARPHTGGQGQAGAGRQAGRQAPEGPGKRSEKAIVKRGPLWFSYVVSGPVTRRQRKETQLC